MGYTKFGEYVRVLRVKNHEVMGDMAKFLDTTTPYLSAVENGKKNIPQEWKEKIIKHYNLKDEERDLLEKAIEISKTQRKIDLKTSTEAQREVALEFQRSFANIDEKTAKEIIKLLEGKGNKNGLHNKTNK